MFLRPWLHNIDTVKTTWPWYIPNTIIFKHVKHLRVQPAREIIFKGPFYVLRESKITIENISKINVVYLFEALSPEQFLISPSVGVIRPRTVKTIKITMFPNVANDVMTSYTFRMLSVAVMSPVRLSRVNKEWITKQPHINFEEMWVTKFEQPADPLLLNAFHLCQYLPLPPTRPRVTAVIPKRYFIQLQKVLRLNEELRFRVRTLKGPTPAVTPAPHIGYLDNLYSQILSTFEYNVNNLQIRDVRLLIVLIELSVFCMGIVIGRFLF